MGVRTLGLALLLALCALSGTDAVRRQRRQTSAVGLASEHLGEARALMAEKYTEQARFRSVDEEALAVADSWSPDSEMGHSVRSNDAPSLLEQVQNTTNTTNGRCPGDCSGYGVCKNSKCICFYGFEGLDCSIQTCKTNCSQHGRCVDGECVCDAGYYGVECLSRGCVNDCNGNGVCRGGTCTCYDKFEGLYCEEVVGCPQGCNVPRGKCEYDAASGNSSCVCFEGYGGAGCKDFLCPNNCLGRGTCNATTGACHCPANKYHGADCGLMFCPNNCSNHGFCNSTNGVCQCDPGYHGDNCAPENCKLNCSSHGQCIPGNATTTASCKCDRQWTGDGCEVELCPDTCNEEKEHGICTPKGCQCNSTWTGRSCNSRRCPDDCHGTLRGICNTKTWECNCLEPWIGESCQEKSCPANCNYRGKCDNGTCVCGDWWTGHKCEVPKCKNGCSSHGACVLPRIELLKSANSPASNFDSTAARSPMSEDIDRAFCKCHSGWGGTDCSERLCPNSCSGRGQCQGGQCFCDPGYYGLDCTLVETIAVQSANKTAEIAAKELCTESCVHGRCMSSVHAKSVFVVNTSSELSILAANSTVFYECFCEPQWGGRFCNESLVQCPAHCKTAAGVCRSDCHKLLKCPHYMGKMCGGDARGECDFNTGQCNCRAPYHGLDCSTASCPGNCGGHGLCNTKDMKCLCYGGWTGMDCSIRVED